MSRLFKRINEKIFTKRVDSDSEDLSSRASTGTNKEKCSQDPSADGPSSVSQCESSNETPKDATEHELLPSSKGQNINDNYDPLLSKTWSVLKNAPSAGEPTGPSRLQKVEDTVQQTDADYQPIVTALQRTVTIQSLEEGIDRYLDGSPALLKALDEVGKIHPVASVIVLTFKAFWTLEMTRRDNDKKVIAVFAEMRDMMQVLLQLRDIKDVDIVAPDGTTLAARLQKLVVTTASDITKCASVCDTYSKKRLIVKVLNGIDWDSRLLGYINLFNQRKNDFQFALTIHIARGVDEVNQKIDALQAANAEINQKLDMLLVLFQRFLTPDEKKIVDFVNKKGGPEACQQDLKTLEELAELESKSAGPAHDDQSGFTISRSNTISKHDMDKLLKDLRE